jgi:hypothetical protein
MRICARSTRLVSPSSFFVAIPTLSGIMLVLFGRAAAIHSIPLTLMPSASAGGCNFDSELPARPADAVCWTPHALPTVVTLTKTPQDLASPALALIQRHRNALADLATSNEPSASGARVRVYNHEAEAPFAVLLPLDRLFDIRAAAALRLWRGMTGRRPGPDLGALTAERRTRFILALRALDARLLGATYPDIAAELFDTAPISKRDWISHELRDQTGRLVRLGFKMMRGGYRQLLLYPYRRSI